MRILKKETIAMTALTVLVAMSSGKAGARIIYALVNERYARAKKLKAGRHARVDEVAFRVTLSRLRNEGLVKNDLRGIWGITRRGRVMAARVVAALRGRDASATPKNPEERIIIVFDIPEKRSNERKLLRFELLALEFSPLQKSVWIGCGPIPADFIAYLRDHNLLRCVHIFSISKKGTTSFTI